MSRTATDLKVPCSMPRDRPSAQRIAVVGHQLNAEVELAFRFPAVAEVGVICGHNVAITAPTAKAMRTSVRRRRRRRGHSAALLLRKRSKPTSGSVCRRGAGVKPITAQRAKGRRFFRCAIRRCCRSGCGSPTSSVVLLMLLLVVMLVLLLLLVVVVVGGAVAGVHRFESP